VTRWSPAQVALQRSLVEAARELVTAHDAVTSEASTARGLE
jgi:hypothetical protein